MSLSAPNVVPEVESHASISEVESRASIESISSVSKAPETLSETSKQIKAMRQLGRPKAAWHTNEGEKGTRVYSTIHLPWEVSWTHASKVLWVVLFTGGERIAKLLASSWVSHALCMLPLDFLRSFGLGWLYVIFVQPSASKHIASMVLFASLWSLGAAILKAIGRHTLSSAANGGAMVLWAIITLPYSKRKFNGVVALIWGILINVALVTTLKNFEDLKNIFPEGMRGLVMPSIVVVYDSIGSTTLAWIWRSCIADQDVLLLKLFAYVSGQVISTAETMRLVGVLSVLGSEELVKELIFNVVSSAAFDCLARTSVMLSFLSWLLGWSMENSPERDLQLRARFGMSYVPFFILAVDLPVALVVGGLSMPWEFYVLLLAALLSELLSDLCCVVCLHRRGESLQATFGRLHSPGGHQRLRLAGFSGFAGIHPVASIPARAEPRRDDLDFMTESDVRLCRCMVLGFDTMGWWLLLSYAGVMVDIGVTALHGSCGWSLSQELCQ